jgi:hypothetical protein
MKVNENIALARAILNRRGIIQDSIEFGDYLKIREMCQKSPGYVGILTRLRFEDGVSDMQEIEHILDTLKETKIDLGQISKMSYDQILSLVLDKVEQKSDNKDLEFIYKDYMYSYYRVYTYEGILKIGSPSWCLKTKSHWIKYQQSHPEQWVVIQNSYRNRIITPENNYLHEYKSNKGWIRYGVSINPKNGNVAGFSDKNSSMDRQFFNWTYMGVVETCINLSRGIKKSFWEHFEGTTPINSKWSRIDDLEKINRLLNRETIQLKDGKYFVSFSYKYENPVRIIALERSDFYVVIPTKKDYGQVSFSNQETLSVLKDAIRDMDRPLYDGIKLALGQTTPEKIRQRSEFFEEFENWIIYKLPKSYLVVRKDLGEEIPVIWVGEQKRNYPKIFPYFYIDRDRFKVFVFTWMTTCDYQDRIIDFIKRRENIPVDDQTYTTTNVTPDENSKPKGLVDKFRDFFKR